MSLDAYAEHVRDLLDGVPELRFRRMFGGWGVYSGSAMFALVADDQLYLKTDGASQDAFAAAGSEPFRHTWANGRTATMNYWRLPAAAEEDAGEARRWAQLAVGAALRAKIPKRKGPLVNKSDLGPGPWDE